MKLSTDVAYLRCSTHNQDFKMQSAELERSFGERFNDAIHLKEICSGAKDSRPKYDVLKEGIRRGTVKNLYIYAFDRLSRSTRELLGTVELCMKHGCKIHCAKTPLELDGLVGRIVLTVLGIASDIEREMTTRRLKDGLRRKMSKEGWRPGGHAEGWYSKKTLAKVKSIKTLAESGTSIRQIVRDTGVNARTIAKIINAKPEDLIEASEARRLRPVKFRKPASPDAYSK